MMSGVTVPGELTRLWEAKVFYVGEASKSIRFDSKSKHFTGIPVWFKERKEVQGCNDLHCYGDNVGLAESSSNTGLQWTGPESRAL